MYPTMKTKCIESNSPKELSKEVNQFIKENMDKTLEFTGITWNHVEFGGRIMFFAYVTYYA